MIHTITTTIKSLLLVIFKIYYHWSLVKQKIQQLPSINMLLFPDTSFRFLYIFNKRLVL